MWLPKAALRAWKWPWEHFKFLSPRPSVLRFVVNDWPVHTHLPFSPVCVCVRACPRLHNTSLARRRWLWCSDQNRKRLHHRLEGRRFCWIFCMEGQSCSLWSTKRAPRNLSFKFVFSPVKTRDVWPERRAGMLRFCAGDVFRRIFKKLELELEWRWSMFKRCFGKYAYLLSPGSRW